MNNYKITAEEIILNELIYTENVWVRTHILCLASKHWICTPIQIPIWEFPYP